eukprot:TRINITY_DN40027_c0_g1_i1.p1 TRINITY_DN40027_c0_g1~~TRINITY_DN40027_c0_g1_i1.p1  ORF type:complete len:346 (+),score=57.91 TRINITY_DN40027_c0_g1_i1:74-1111(+)
MAAVFRQLRRNPTACALVSATGLGCSLFNRQQLCSAAQSAASPGTCLKGRRAVVVGGTSGIGHGIALSLAKAGCSVTVVGRSEERGAAIVAELIAEAAADSAAEGSPSFCFKSLDCFALPACNDFASKVVADGRPLDYLVLTQGMATLQGWTPTPPASGGLDEKLTLHYWSRMVLAKKLAPVLEMSDDSRVLFVLSAGMHGAYANYANDPELCNGSYSLKAAADAAGFYTDIACDQLSSEHPKVTFMHASPGFVATNWGTEMPTVVRLLVRGMQAFGRSKEDCADLLLKGLVLPTYGGGGWYLLDQYGEASAKETGMHQAAKEIVWAHTKRVIAKLGSVERTDIE